MLILGPSLHFWFNFMSKVLPKRDIMTTLKKIVMGQILFGPAMTVIFFSVNAALQGKTNSIIFTRHVNKVLFLGLRTAPTSFYALFYLVLVKVIQS